MRAPAQIVPKTPVQILGKLCQPVSAVGHHGFRYDKDFSGIQRIRKLLRLQPHQHSVLPELVFFHFRLKSSAVYKGHGITCPCIFCCSLFCQNQKWTVLMTGGPSSASDHIISMRYRNSLIIPLHRMTSVKTDHIIFSCHKIKTRRSRFFKINDVLFCIDDLRTSGDHIVFWQYPIEKCHLNSGPPIFQHHFQCLCFFLSSIHCRKSR